MAIFNGKHILLVGLKGKDGKDGKGWTDEQINLLESVFAESEMTTQGAIYAAALIESLRGTSPVVTHTVTFAMGGHGTQIQPQTVNDGGFATRPADPTESGWNFGGWYTNAGYTTAFDFTTPVTGDITLYAKWTVVVPVTYTVTFAMGGHGTQIQPQTVEEGGRATRPTDPAEDDWEFDGWFTNSGYSTEYNFATPVTSDITLYAKWTSELHTVTFAMGGHGTQITPLTVINGGVATRPADPTEEDWTFGGWYTTSALETVYDFDSPVYADITLYAKWTNVAPTTYSVGFDMNGHGADIPSQTVIAGGFATRPEDPSAEGWNFRDWYTSPRLSNKYDFNTPVTGSFTLYAKWIEQISLELTNDGDENKSLLNEALAESDVKIVPAGDYPITPGVTVDGHELDLNDSHLTSTVLRDEGSIFTLTGESPCIKNGQISGLYSAAPGEAGYVKFELESAVLLIDGGFENGLIDGVTFDHICGYAIKEYGNSYIEYEDVFNKRQASPLEEVGPDETIGDKYICSFTLGNSSLPYVTARDAFGFKRGISDNLVSYTFFDADDQEISTAYGIPGVAIEKPSGAVSVKVTTTRESYMQYGLMEYKYDNCLTIQNCEFVCNQRLGIANLPGISYVTDCESRSNGYPREDHTGISWDDSTSGFVDIEDTQTQTPIMYVVRCTSENENLGVASRCYILEVDGCSLPVVAYSGWTADVTNHDGCVKCMTWDVTTTVVVKDSTLRDMYLAKIGPNMSIENTTVELCEALNYLPGFQCDADLPVRDINVQLNGVVVGTITGSKDSKYIQLATKQGSDLTIDLPMIEDWKGIRVAQGDCYGITANSLVLPNSHTIYSCDFTVADERCYKMNVAATVADAFNGEYNDCTFEISYNKPFRPTALRVDTTFDLTFTDCDFTIEDGLYLFGDIFKVGSKVTFDGCTLNGTPIDSTTASEIVCETDGIFDVVVV